MFDYKKRSLLWGVGTLCNVFGNDQSYAAYLQGSVLEDMQKDGAMWVMTCVPPWDNLMLMLKNEQR